MDYWEECVSEACDDCGLIITKEQIECIAGWVEGAHENYGMAHGYECIPNPMESEVKSLKMQIEKLEEKHENKIYGVKKGVAMRRNVGVHNVHIEDDGHVTYDRR